MLTLREYQTEAVYAAYAWLNAHAEGNPCIVMPTGTGKSLVIAKITQDTLDAGGRVCILAHVKELLQQNAQKLSALMQGAEYGIFCAGLRRKDTEQRVIFASIQSLANSPEACGTFDLLIIDEAHLIPPDGEGRYQSYIAYAKAQNPRLRIAGLTATPYRLQGGLLCGEDRILTEVAYEVPVKEMIVKGYLSEPKNRHGLEVDISKCHIVNGDFSESDTAAAYTTNSVIRATGNDLLQKSRGRRLTLVFCTCIDHCQELAKYMRSVSQERIEVVTGDTPPEERAAILRAAKGELQTDLYGRKEQPIRYLINCNVLTTGFDAPQIDCIALMRPTVSTALYVQMLGRGLRTCEGKKDCMVLDYGGNIQRHGPVDMVSPVSSGKGGKKAGIAERDAKEASPCPECGFYNIAGKAICSNCRALLRTLCDTYAHAGDVISLQGDKEVTGWSMAEHAKNGNPDAPHTVKVTYFLTLDTEISEYVCPEHSGYARGKFEMWWGQRAPAGLSAPMTAEETARLKPLLKMPSKVRITPQRNNPKFAEIEPLEWAEQTDKPFGLSDIDALYGDGGIDDLGDIPF